MQVIAKHEGKLTIEAGLIFVLLALLLCDVLAGLLSIGGSGGIRGRSGGICSS